MALGNAVAAPRAHYQGRPDSVEVEHDGFGRAVLDSLARRGPASYTSPTIAQVNAILRTPDGWVGVGDPRGGSAAAGW
jgi:gamma-glutamyltranspeptidase